MKTLAALTALAALTLTQAACIIVVKGEGGGHGHKDAAYAVEVEDDDRPKMGVFLAPVDGALASQLGIDAGCATLIQGVVEGGAADRAGLEAHDVIIRVEDETCASPDEVREEVRERGKGDPLRLKVLRAGEPHRFTVTLQ